MRTSQCLFNSANALRNVFIGNAIALDAQAPGELQRLLLPSVRPFFQPSCYSPSPRRSFSTHHVAQLRWSRPAPGSGDAKPATDRSMRDYDILYPWIQLRQEDGSLTQPKRTTNVLKKLNMESQTLILLAAPRTDDSSKGPQYPICRIADRKVEQEKEDANKKKGPKLVSKELELNWAIAPHDLQIRMAQLKKFLSKGYQVQVRMLTPKKRNKRKATLDEAKEVFRIVKETVAEVPRAKETKGMEGTVGDVVILHLHAPAGGAEAEEASTVTEAEKPAATEV
ncbi:uncharacterized protein B0T15DRAFT_525028 [Chaetomium strumarium]|uniref:Translation initiation factor 3 C-terminal domain-containing protein n=1 Tax=Chaetomium strumarium TaxID=1170767 RepID=A0AAJ0M4P3_9PEZI|nr:hypothetical protein B0T15DRAFT_525028 [Chaetomium strumarium]